MSTADRNKIIIASAVAVIAIIVIVFFLRGRGAKQPAATAGSTGGFGQTAAGPGAGGAAAPGQTAPGAPGGAAGAGGVGAAAGGPAAPGATQVAQAPMGPAYVPGSPILMNSGPGEPTRSDPFMTFDAPVQPVPPEVTANLPPVVLQAGGLRPPGMPEGVGGPLGRRRVAGLMFNDGAWAILEQENQSFVVKPGDIVDGNRITAINPDAIFVTDAQGQRWRVNLRPLASTGGGPVSSSVPGMPETPPVSD